MRTNAPEAEPTNRSIGVRRQRGTNNIGDFNVEDVVGVRICRTREANSVGPSGFGLGNRRQ